MSSSPWDILSWQDHPDLRLRQALNRLQSKSRAQVQPHHIVAACLKEPDHQLADTIRLTLRKPGNVEAVISVVVGRLEALTAQDETAASSINDYSSCTALALQEWRDRWMAEGGERCSCGFELLLYCALKRIDGSATEALQGECNIPQLIAALAQKIVASRGNFRSATPPEKPVLMETSPTTSIEGVLNLLDLSSLAASGNAPVLGESAPWKSALQECARALRRRHVRHILLVGERGVGKTELVIELARLLQLGIWRGSETMRIHLADQRFVDLEESRSQLIALLSHIRPGVERVLAVDGLARLLRGEGGKSNLPLLLHRLHESSGRLLALITPQEYEDVFASEPAVVDFFERIDVAEPTMEEVLPLVCHYAQGLSLKYGLGIPQVCIELAVRLSSEYILSDQLPAKAIKLLHAACDEASLLYDAPGEKHLLSEDNVIQVAARRTGMPEETLRGIAERTDYAEVLRQRVFGQELAIQDVAGELGLIKGGMTDAGKPASVMLFLGQTGTGKTELAKALASLYSPSQKLKVYTLGNCIEPHSVSTLIGVPPGYVGHDQGGRLINDLNAEPYSVFLLDEADKAHPDVLQPFLNLFDEGWIMDQRGRRGYADRAIFILTSNVGQRMLGDMVRQDRPWEEIIDRMREAVTQLKHSKSNRPVFSAEFLARIKRFILFRPLELAALAAITRKAVADLCEGWRKKRGKLLQIEEVLTDRLSQAAMDVNQQNQREGGRIVRKLVSEWIEMPLQLATSHEANAYRQANRVRVILDRSRDKGGTAHPPIDIQWD